jgi:ribosomal protein S19E (S16A)
MPGHFAKASGAVIRHILKQLEELKVVEKDSKGYHFVYSNF